MMKFALLLLFASTFALGQALPEHRHQCGISAIDSAIQRITTVWKDAYNEGNPNRVAALYSADATYLTQHFATGIVHGRPAIAAYVKRGTDAKYRIDSIKVLASDCSRNFAYAITRYDAMNGKERTFGVNLVVLRKIKGEWLIVAHEAAVPDPSSAIQSLDLPQ